MRNKDAVPLKTETINVEPHWPSIKEVAKALRNKYGKDVFILNETV